MADTQNTKVQEQDIHQLLKVKREKLANLQQAGKDPFQITKYDVTHHSTDIKNNFEELEGKTVRIAGRVMSKRVMGKASFCNVQDLPGNIRYMWLETASVKSPMRISRSTMWAIS